MLRVDTQLATRNSQLDTTMIEVPIYDQSGKQLESIKIDEAKLGGEVNKPLLKQALVYYHANQRQGSVRPMVQSTTCLAHDRASAR